MNSSEEIKLSPARKFLLLVITILVIPTAIICLLEVSVRLFSPGYPTSFFIKEKLTDGKEVYRANYLAAKRFFAGNLARKPLPEIFAAKKSADTVRIFVLGESAARGEFLADFSFARILQAAMQRNCPGKKIEIINTGIPAINSWVINEIATEIVSYQPDLVIVYAGHNEYIGPFGPSSVFSGNTNRTKAKLGIFASSLQIIQKLKSDKLPSSLSKGWQGLEMFSKNSVEPGSPQIAICQSNWRQNLNEILVTLNSNSIKTVVCSVPSNLLDCPPFMSKQLKPADQTLVQQLKDSFNQENWSKIDQLFAANGEILSNHALASWIYGWAKLKQGKQMEAQKSFKQARDFDCFKVRTSSSLNEITKMAAAKASAIFIDLEKFFDDSSENGVTGEALIYDHVHLTETGHYLVAKRIFAELIKNGFLETHQIAPRIPMETDAMKMVGFTDFDRIHNLKNIIASVKNKPFTLQFRHDHQVKKLEDKLAKIVATNQPTKNIQFTTLALEQSPESWILPYRLALMYSETGHMEEALAYYKRALSKNPFNIDILNNLGTVFINAGQLIEADKYLRAAISLAPNFADAFFNLGLSAAKRKQPQAAIKNYLSAISIEAGFAKATRNLANIYFNQKQFSRAEIYYQKAFSTNPSDINSLLGLANSLAQQNRDHEAMEFYNQAIAPPFLDNPLGHYSLALALEKQKKFTEALNLYERAMKLNFAPAAKRATNILAQEKINTSLDTKILICKEICKISDYADPWDLQLFASTLAEKGELEQAGHILQKALDAARKKGETNLIRDLEDSLRAIAKAD